MIVLTYIKLHQSAMRDIVLLVDHAIKKKDKNKLTRVPLVDKKSISSMRGGYTERWRKGTDSRAISLCTGLKKKKKAYE